ncbi:Pre-mRNA-processing ATP-dependent RNA helicase [Venturia inaequalis]|nr:Pre-mRNA-processing ATP-dependent RNA helicase [Venturia inaequalis]
MSARVTATRSTTESPIGGTIVPDTSSLPTTTKPSASSTDKGGAIFQIPTTTTTLPSPPPITTAPTPISTTIPPAAHKQQPTSTNLSPIIGGTIGGILLTLLAVLVFYHWKKKKPRKELNLHTIPYSVATPFSVNTLPRPDTMSTTSTTSDAPGFIHEKRVTADTIVERNDSTKVSDDGEEGGEEEEQTPVELPTHNSRTFLPQIVGAGCNNPPLELPRSMNLPSPPLPHAESPSQDFHTARTEIERDVIVSPVNPMAAVRISTVSPFVASAAFPNSNPDLKNPPYVMACAGVNKKQTAKGQGETYPGKRAYSPWRMGDGAGMKEKVTSRPIIEPVWQAPLRETIALKMWEGPEDVGLCV